MGRCVVSRLPDSNREILYARRFLVVLRECSDTRQFASYGDNHETPLHYGHRAILPRRSPVWIAPSLPSISLDLRVSVRRINTASSSTSPSWRPGICGHDPRRGGHHAQRAAPPADGGAPPGAHRGPHADDRPGYFRVHHGGASVGLAPSTINTKVGLLAGFFDVSARRRPDDAATGPRRRHRLLTPLVLPKPIPDADLTAFFQVIDAVRDRLIFLFMLRCGLRVSEVCALPWDAIDLRCRDRPHQPGQRAGRSDRVSVPGCGAGPRRSGAPTTRPACISFPVRNGIEPTSSGPTSTA